jgi:hypothetical protein
MRVEFRISASPWRKSPFLLKAGMEINPQKAARAAQKNGAGRV